MSKENVVDKRIRPKFVRVHHVPIKKIIIPILVFCLILYIHLALCRIYVKYYMGKVSYWYSMIF